MCRVMIVEDDSTWMEIMRTVVQRFSDVELLSSHRSGDTAFDELTADDSIDMVISDLVLTTSRVQGNDLFELSKRRGIRFIAVTSEPCLAPLDCKTVVCKDQLISFLDRFDVRRRKNPGVPRKYRGATLDQFLNAVSLR